MAVYLKQLNNSIFYQMARHVLRVVSVGIFFRATRVRGAAKEGGVGGSQPQRNAPTQEVEHDEKSHMQLVANRPDSRLAFHGSGLGRRAEPC